MVRFPRRLLAGFVIGALGSLAACGDTSSDDSKSAKSSSAGAAAASFPAAKESDAAEVKARLVALFEVAKVGGGAKAAAFIVYKGGDEARRYKMAAMYEGDEIKQIDHAVKMLREHLDVGAPTVEKAEAIPKGVEKWVAVIVRLGDGGGARRVKYSFINVGGVWLLGDIEER